MGYIFIRGDRPASSTSSLQKLEAQSKVGSELIYLVYCTKEVACQSIMLKEVEFEQFRSIAIFEDNSESLLLVGNSVYSTGRSIVRSGFLFLLELVADRKTDIHHIPSNNELDDNFTKILNRATFWKLIAMI